MTEPVHIHLEIPQELADQFPEGEEFSCRLVREEDGTLVLCVGSASEPTPERP